VNGYLKVKKNRVLLRVKTFCQRNNECALCVIASIAHYYDTKINYESVCKIAPKDAMSDGLWTVEQAMILNKLGFTKVTIVTLNLNIFDFGWNRLSKKGIINRLKRVQTYMKREERYNEAIMAKKYIKWLSRKDCDNSIIIDSNFVKHIRQQINAYRPVGAKYNSTSLWKYSKGGWQYDRDIKGEAYQHEVVIRGYDENGLSIADSDHSGKRYYKIKWFDFLTNVGDDGDLLLVG